MTARLRIAIAGAASLRGKELNEALAESAFASADFLLMDDAEALGQVESVGDEVTFVQQITPASFEGADFSFFAGSPELTQRHWRSAARAGSSIIDLSGALEGQPGVAVCAPWIAEPASGAAVTLDTTAVVPAHPAAVVLALLLQRIQRTSAVRAAFATFFEPASEHGRAAMDELHQQTVSLLSFQKLPQEIYDAQVAFNAIAALGDAAKVSLSKIEDRIRRHFALLSAGRLPEVAIQLVQAPVFHGYTVSLGFELERPIDSGALMSAMGGDHIEVVEADSDAPSNLSAAGQEMVLARVRPADGRPGAQTRYWLWAAADNLKLTALNAVACALELKRLRPHGQVQ